ncbi:hypothetical protein LTR37_006235 [Vermiconidia calcicola]|uniref:Uncharacterized protein n=1 Tax=Vermiconidia calcicola TaxID=1690605 RepID=A0ACC3NH19_9PEZI|nr:hypothetical protein LTR37_006235 [Vermiconidia calcicola]
MQHTSRLEDPGVAQSETRAQSQGSLILVTGATGFIGAHIVNEALKAGYKVRGTSRSEERAEYTKKVFEYHPNYSTAVVSGFEQEGIFDDVVKGCDAIIHVATATSFDPDPHNVVGPTVAGVESILRSAAKTPSVKRFVLTSSSVAALLPQPGNELTVGVDDWNDEVYEQAWAPPPYTPDRAFATYAASKIAGEKAFWKFVKEEKPNFVANTVLPNFNIGTILTAGGPTGSAVPSVLGGNIPPFPSQYHIDVIDNARIHLIAAALDPCIKNERIFAFNKTFTWTDIIEILKELRPDAKTIASPPENDERHLSKVPNELGAELLKKWYDQKGEYTSLRESIEASIEGLD